MGRLDWPMVSRASFVSHRACYPINLESCVFTTILAASVRMAQYSTLSLLRSCALFAGVVPYFYYVAERSEVEVLGGVVD